MKVLIVHNRYRSAQPSGENAVVDTEAALLAGQGCAVSMLEARSDDIASWPLARRAALPGRVVWSIDGYRRTSAAIARFRPDVVHFHNTFPLLSPSSLWAARQSGAGVVHTLHNFRPLCPGGSLYRDGAPCEDCLGRLPLPSLVHGCYRDSRLATAPLAAMDGVHRLLGTWTRCVDVFVTPSEFARDRYLAAGWRPEQFAVKHNTVDIPPLEAATANGHFVHMGRIAPEKGSGVLLSAWGVAFPGGESTLRLVGDGLESLDPALARRPPRGVEVLGRLEPAQALAALAGARALVVPSQLYEVFPRVIVEAYALGIPVVASRVGPLPELVAHDRTGLLFASGATHELAGHLRLLASSDETVRRLGAGARAAFEEKYSPDVTTRRLLEIYRRAIRLAGQRRTRRDLADGALLQLDDEVPQPEPVR
jgi:glycosyltransferase involved in cell wall biosynthesis